MAEDKKLQSIKCSACNGELGKSSRYDSEEEESIPIARCLSCGAEYDQETDLYYKLFADDLTADKNNSVFKLGLKGTLAGIEYEIIGRIRYQDEEEYEQATWDEWFAVSAEGTYHYFVEEDGEVASYTDYIPQVIDLESTPAIFEGKRLREDDSYVARIVLAEGELPWQPEIGEPVTCWDVKHQGVKYTIEKSDAEVSVTKGDAITYREIIEAFGLEQFREAYASTMTKRKTCQLKAAIYCAAALTSLGLLISACTGQKTIPGIMESSQVIIDNQLTTESGQPIKANPRVKSTVPPSSQQVYMSQILYGPFNLPDDSALYDVDIRIDQDIQRLSLQWQSVRFMLLSAERFGKVVENPKDPAKLRDLFDEVDSLKEPVESYVVSGDFWDEEGRDSEGYWHESDVSLTRDFVLDKGGSYYGYLEMFSNKPRKINSVKVGITRTHSMRYYAIAMVLFSILMILNFRKSRQHNELPFDMS